MQAPAPEKGCGDFFNVTRDYDPGNPSHHSMRKEIDEHFNGTPGWIRVYHTDIPPEHQLTLSKGDIVKITGIPPEGGHYGLPEGFIWFDSKSGKYITNPADQKIGVFWGFHGAEGPAVPFTLTLKSMFGEVLKVEVDRNTTIQELKAKVCLLKNELDVDRLRILYNHYPLEEERAKIGELGLSEESDLYFMAQGGGWGGQKRRQARRYEHCHIAAPEPEPAAAASAGIRLAARRGVAGKQSRAPIWCCGSSRPTGDLRLRGESERGDRIWSAGTEEYETEQAKREDEWSVNDVRHRLGTSARRASGGSRGGGRDRRKYSQLKISKRRKSKRKRKSKKRKKTKRTRDWGKNKTRRK